MIGDYISGHRQMSYPPLKMLIIVALFLVIIENLPEWSLFRYAPRHSYHTLPEGFFIQVFMATLTC